jgi:hypothetical protein
MTPDRFHRAVIVVALCAATLGAWVANSSVAEAASPPPVTINSCAPIISAPNPLITPGPSFMGMPLASTSNGMSIKFVNESKVVAKLVNFAVESNGSHFVIRDVGTFSPGISIDHQFNNGSGQAFLLPSFIAPNVTCRVASVEFADGTVWRRGQTAALEPPPPSPHGLIATPARLTLDRQTEAKIFFVQSPARVAGFKETDNCSGIAAVNVGTAGDAAVTYSVRPLGPGTCTAHVINEDGTTVSVPITVH